MFARIARISAIGLAAVALAGCSASVSATTPPDTIASLAEDALEEQVGVRPEVDCGEDSIALKEGEVVDCLLTDPSNGDEYDAEVTLTKVDGTNVTVSVEVAETPN